MRRLHSHRPADQAVPPLLRSLVRHATQAPQLTPLNQTRRMAISATGSWAGPPRELSTRRIQGPAWPGSCALDADAVRSSRRWGSATPWRPGCSSRYPGSRPVGVWSPSPPLTAAAWADTSASGSRIREAAAVKARMAAELGEPVSFGGHTATPSRPRPAWPPWTMAFPRARPGRKPEWLPGPGPGRPERQLDTAHLRSQPYEEALAGLDHAARHRAVRGRADPAARRPVVARTVSPPRNPAGSRAVRPGLPPPRAPISR